MKHEVFFRKHPVFTGEELAKHLASHGKVGKRTQEALLAYHQKTGHIIRIRHGLYAVIPPGADTASYPVDPFLIAAKLTLDSVLSHHTALEFHGKAYSVYSHLMYSSSRPLRPLMFRSHVFRGTQFPRTLLRAGKIHVGVLISECAGVDFRVTSLERTLVDVLDRPDLSGSWEEIWQSLESIEFFDLDKVVEYALLLENATTVAKVGFFLEQRREPLMVEDHYLKALHDMRPRQPHYFIRRKRKNCHLVKEWNLLIPSEILNKSWEETL